MGDPIDTSDAPWNRKGFDTWALERFGTSDYIGIPLPHKEGAELQNIQSGMWNHDGSELWVTAGGNLEDDFTEPSSNSELFYEMGITPTPILNPDIDDRMYEAGIETSETEYRIDFLSDVSKQDRSLGKLPRSVRVLRVILSDPKIRCYLA